MSLPCPLLSVYHPYMVFINTAINFNGADCFHKFPNPLHIILLGTSKQVFLVCAEALLGCAFQYLHRHGSYKHQFFISSNIENTKKTPRWINYSRHKYLHCFIK